VTGEVHPYNERLAIEEAAKRGFPIAAVHILISNIARSGNRGVARVWRVDPEPDVFLHSVAGSESLDRVSVKVLDALYPPGLPSRIPIALVLGERGTIRIARDLERFLRVARRGVAMSTRTHTTILGRPVERLSTSAGDGPEHLLSDPRVDSLVHAVSPRRVVGRGLRLDHVSVTAVVEAPAKTSRRTRREALRVAIEATTGPVCIGIDDPDAERLLAGVEPGRVIMVASRQSHPRVTSHLESGGAVVLPRLESSEPAVELRRRGVPAERIPLSLLRVGSGPVDESLLRRLVWTAALAFGLGVTGPPPPPAEDEEDSRLRMPTASRETPGAS
jgi:cyanophycin synthetase